VKLVDLDPRWVDGPLFSADDPRWDVLCTHVLCYGADRRGVALTFLCPHCVAEKLEPVRLCYTLWNPTDGLQVLYLVNGKWTAIEDGEHGDDERNFLWPASWTRVGTDFEDLTLIPNNVAATDATWVRYGRKHWYGAIVNGAVINRTPGTTTVFTAQRSGP
jgi:hypothetical protein